MRMFQGQWWFHIFPRPMVRARPELSGTLPVCSCPRWRPRPQCARLPVQSRSSLHTQLHLDVSSCPYSEPLWTGRLLRKPKLGATPATSTSALRKGKNLIEITQLTPVAGVDGIAMRRAEHTMSHENKVTKIVTAPTSARADKWSILVLQ